MPETHPNRFAVYAWSVAALVVFAIIVFCGIPSVRTSARATYEDLRLALSPSAEMALQYGTRHFDAMHPYDYDIERAEHLFDYASELDSKLPFVQHQRARIAFLKGDFRRALELIDIEIKTNPQPLPASYYVRGLIKGFAGDYAGAAKDYEVYLRSDSTSWAAVNDYSWVLLKAGRAEDALTAVIWALNESPDNPWLLNTKATALFELNRLEEANETAQAAERLAADITEGDWLRAYPGNDPLAATDGVIAFKTAVTENMHSIRKAYDASKKSVQ